MNHHVASEVVAESLQAELSRGTPSPLTPITQIDGSVTILRITDIKPYERNPRQAANPFFETIKASIRQRGMDSPLKVTRRPSETHYVVAAGGNSRLRAQLELWRETAEPRFETVPVVIKAWRSESDVIAGHLIENEQHGEMTFWDKARGLVALKAELEKEQGTSLSLRQWESALLDIGVHVGKDALSSYLFAVERLAPLGPALVTVSRNDVRDQLQPCFRRLSRLAQKFGVGDAALYAHTLDPIMVATSQTQQFSTARFCADSETALAKTLQLSLNALRAMLAALERAPELILEDLRTLEARARPTSSAPNAPSEASLRRDQPPSPRQVVAVSRGDKLNLCAPAVFSGELRAAKAEALENAVTELAMSTGVGDCVHWSNQAPLMFYVELPAAPLDLQSDSARRHAGWWLLALLSGQFDPEVALRLPATSRWRKAIFGEGNGDEHSLPLAIETELGGPLTPDALIGWITLPADLVGDRILACLGAARAVLTRSSVRDATVDATAAES